MKQLYDLVGISRQAHHQNVKRQERMMLEEEILLEEVKKVSYVQDKSQNKDKS